MDAVQSRCLWKPGLFPMMVSFQLKALFGKTPGQSSSMIPLEGSIPPRKKLVPLSLLKLFLVSILGVQSLYHYRSSTKLFISATTVQQLALKIVLVNKSKNKIPNFRLQKSRFESVKIQFRCINKTLYTVTNVYTLFSPRTKCQ